MINAIEIGDLIIDNREREGIVLARCDPPDASWLAIQNDRRVLTLGECRWWTVVPSTGGAICVPESRREPIPPEELREPEEDN